MKRLAMGGMIAAVVFAAVVLLPSKQAEAARVRVHVGAYYAGYPGYVGYAPYYSPYVVRYRPRYVAPPVRVYAYRPPVVYAPAPRVCVPAPVYVPAVPPPPCVQYGVWER